MVVKVTLEFENVAAMLAHFKTDNAETAKPGKPAKPAADPAPTPPPAASSAASTAPAPPPAAKVKTYAETPLSTMLNDCVKAQKLAEAKAVLKKYGAEKGPQLKPEDFDAVQAEVQAILDGAALG